MRKPKPPLEREVQKAVVALYRAFGCQVYMLSQGYRKERGGTRQSPGLADLYILLPVRATGDALWFEVKRPGGKQRPAQQGFQRACEAAGVRYVLGGVEEAKDHLRALGLIATVGAGGARTAQEPARAPKSFPAGPSGFPTF